MRVPGRAHTQIFQLSPMREPKSNDVPVLMSTPGTQGLFSKEYSPVKRNQSSLEKLLDSRAGAGKIQD